MFIKQVFADVINLRILREGAYSEVSRWVLNAIACIPIREREIPVSFWVSCSRERDTYRRGVERNATAEAQLGVKQ